MNMLWLILRVADVLLYAGAVSGLLMHWRTLRHRDLPGMRWGLVGLFASLTYGVVETLQQGLPGGPRLIPVTAALLVLCVSFYLRSIQRSTPAARRLRKADRD